MARVIISAGHTQNEPGAVVDDLREVDLTYKIATNITTKLRNKGIITLSVPPELDLLARIDWINKTGYKEELDDICIEVHINDGGKSGLEGWYKDRGGNKSQELTQAIIEEACNITGLENQGVKSEYDHSLKTLALVHNTAPTSALVECLYIDNLSDQKFLKDDSKLDLLAEGMVKGILKFFGIESPRDKISQPARSQMKGKSASPVFPYTSGYSPPPPMQSQPYSPYSPSYTGWGSGPQVQPPVAKSREERKKMILEMYHKILGRKVNEQDLNYFFNLGLTEEQMIKRLVESQEHADMVKEGQEYKKIKPEYDKLKIEAQELKSQLKDKEGLIVQQNELIGQKNKTIMDLQQGLKLVPPSPGGDLSGKEGVFPQIGSPNYQQITQAKDTFLDKVLRKLNDIFD